MIHGIGYFEALIIAFGFVCTIYAIFATAVNLLNWLDTKPWASKPFITHSSLEGWERETKDWRERK